MQGARKPAMWMPWIKGSLSLPRLEVFVLGEAGPSEVMVSTIQLSAEGKGSERQLSDGELGSVLGEVRCYHGDPL